MKKLVVYKSFFGATKSYATWISEAINASLLDFWKASRKIIADNDLIVICSGTYVGWMPLVQYLKANWDILGDKKVVIVAVGAVPESSLDSKRTYEKIPDEIRRSVRYFKLQSVLGPARNAIVKKKNIKEVVEYIKKLDTKKSANRSLKKPTRKPRSKHGYSKT
ncbi:hypothetical protein JW962_00835 [Candidatus Dojkabacteria bacterium]|nr:hypothetical protein [Candidatus Dojkabacteria bacterium]